MSGREGEERMRDAVREVLRDLVPEILRETTARPSNAHANGNGHAAGVGNRPASPPGHAPDAGPVNLSPVVPRVPAPPVAAVLRPSTWSRPPAPGEIIGSSDGAPAGPPGPEVAPSPATPRAERLRAAFQESDLRPGRPPVQTGSTTPSPAEGPGGAPPVGATEQARLEAVTIDSDEDLAAFVRRLMTRLENPRERLAIRTGQLRFSLRRRGAAPSGGGAGSQAPSIRVEKGAVTERMIRAAAADGKRLVLAPGAVLTPLAREQARARRVEIERERRC